MYQLIPAVPTPPPQAFGLKLVPEGRAISTILVSGGGEMDCLANVCK